VKLEKNIKLTDNNWQGYQIVENAHKIHCASERNINLSHQVDCSSIPVAYKKWIFWA
jgi:hypothetical protein